MSDFNPAVKLVNVNKQFTSRPNEMSTMAVDNLNLDIADGEFFSLLGPSGCGKTTTLRMIAGFEEPTSGQILLNGENVAHLPPFHRPVNTVFQDYALFPHMTVAQNIGFGLEMEGKSSDFIGGRIREMLDLVQLPNMERRFPRQLSGGQQQRVALARALVKEPKVLLLDEPLGALDLKLRKQMQLELKQMQRRLGITFIYVTHDQEEALTMSDRIAVMSKGKVLQIGKPWEIYDAPTNRFVADFIGETNFLQGSVDEIRDGGWAKVWISDKYQLEVNTRLMPVREEMEVTIAVRPEKLNVVPATVRVVNGIPGVIEEQVYIGTDTRYLIRLPDDQMLVARVQNGVSEQTEYDLGAEVNVHFPPQFTLILTD